MWKGGKGKGKGKDNGKRANRIFTFTPEVKGQEKPKGKIGTSVTEDNVPGTPDAKSENNVPCTPDAKFETPWKHSLRKVFFDVAETPKGETKQSPSPESHLSSLKLDSPIKRDNVDTERREKPASPPFQIYTNWEKWEERRREKASKIESPLKIFVPKKSNQIATAKDKSPVKTPVSAPAEVSQEEPMNAPAEVPQEEPMSAPAEVPQEEPMSAPAEVPQKEPTRYIFNNPFFDQADGVTRTSKIFPGLPQPSETTCSSRLKSFFVFSKPLGDGQFSTCYKVLHLLDGCYYAIKVSKRQYDLLDSANNTYVRAHGEIQALSFLANHENIVAYYGAWYENSKQHIQMEYCDETLESKSLRGDLTTEFDFRNVFFQLLRGITHMHERGVVHLDIKPANILVKNGFYKIGDFGLAVSADGQLSGDTFSTVGDGRYQPANTGGCKTKVDIFALAVTVYEIMLRHHLGGRKNVPLKRVEDYPRAYEFKIDFRLPGYERPFLELLQSMLRHNSSSRPSASEIFNNPMFDDVREFLEKQSNL